MRVNSKRKGQTRPYKTDNIVRKDLNRRRYFMNIKDLLKDAYKDGMSLEEINRALESIELPTDNSGEIERLKNALSKSNSEAADYKKQLREKMSAEEAKAKEDAEKFEELQARYEALLRKDMVTENKARLLALGYDDTLATETAEAMVNGETDKVFAAQKKHLDSLEKRIREDVLKDTPKPTGGSGKNTITKEQLRGMTAQERYDFSVKNPEQYKEAYGGN
jgi:hypothetical protein